MSAAVAVLWLKRKGKPYPLVRWPDPVWCVDISDVSNAYITMGPWRP